MDHDDGFTKAGNDSSISEVTNGKSFDNSNQVTNKVGTNKVGKRRRTDDNFDTCTDLVKNHNSISDADDSSGSSNLYDSFDEAAKERDTVEPIRTAMCKSETTDPILNGLAINQHKLPPVGNDSDLSE